MESLESELVGVFDFCRNFPRRPEKSIDRDNVYEHVEKVFEKVSNCVLLEGGVLSGKSEFLAGYMRRNPDSAIGTFLSPRDTYFYSPEYVRLVLAEQMHWLITKTVANFDAVDDQQYAKLLHQLQKLSKRKAITFVIDGLAPRGQPESRLNQEIMALLPMNQQDFRFLISGAPVFEDDFRVFCKSFKTIPLIELAKEECAEFFSDMPMLSVKDLADIRKFCSGSIGQMAKLKSLLLNGGVAVEDLLKNGGGGLDDLMEIEWQTLSPNSEVSSLLAFLSFSNRQLPLSQLALMAGVREDQIASKLVLCSFVSIDLVAGTCSIRSLAQKDFLQKKLISLEPKIQDAFLNILLKEPESKDSIRYLPDQLMKVGRYEDLIQRLDVGHFCRLLDSQRSLRALKSNSDLGLQASKEIKDEASQAKFSISGSVISGLTFSVGSKSKIEALISLGAIDDAIEIGLAAPTGEEKFQLLAATVRALYEEKLHIPSELKAEIKQLRESISVDAMGDLAIDVACDLIVIDLDGAVDIFNKVQALIKDPAHETSISDSDEHHGAKKTELDNSGVRNIELRMSERHHKRFAEALGLIVDRTSVEQLTGRLGQFADVSGDLMFLKEWLSRRRKEIGAHLVADRALDLMLKDLSRSPRIEDLRAIAVVLPYTKEVEEAERLAKRIEALIGTELFLGTSVASVRLQMLLERVRYRYAAPAAELSILELFFKVESLADVSMRVACFSWMLYSLQKFENAEDLEKKTSLISQTTKSLLEGIGTLLDSSADQFSAVQGALYALAQADFSLALGLAGRLNTEDRRDDAHAFLANEVFAEKIYTGNPGFALQCIDRIEDENKRSKAIISGLHRIEIHCAKGEVSGCNNGLFRLWRSLRVANYRFQGLIYALQIAFHLKMDQKIIEEIKVEVNVTWPLIMVDWVRCNLAYILARAVAKLDRDFSENWLRKSLDEERKLKVPPENFSNALRLVGGLVVRSYSYVADNEDELSNHEFKKVEAIIGALPVPQDRINLWCELGIRLFYMGKGKLSKAICIAHVEPTLGEGAEQNEFVKEILIAEAAPFMFLIHQASATFHLEKIKSRARRDAAISEICFALLKKRSSYDAYKSPDNDEYDMDAATAASIISLARNVETDFVLFGLVQALSSSLIAKRNESKIRRTQVADFLSSLTEIVNIKLPDSKNIKHDGFKISCLAYIYKARASCGHSASGADWENLFKNARGISNVADRAVVTAIVAVAAKTKMATIDPNWITLVRDDASKIPTMADRIDRYVWLAQIVDSSSRPHALALAKDGMELTVSLDKGADSFEKQSKILDFVFNIDPDLVEKYIELADQDQAKEPNKKGLEDRAKLKKLQREAAEDPSNIDLGDTTDEDLAELCVRNLAALNASRIIARPIEDFRLLGARAAAISIVNAYSIWSWITENAIKKGGANSKGAKIVENLFAAYINSGSLLLSLLRGSANVMHSGDFAVDGLVRPGDRDAVIDRIAEWARKSNGSTILISDPFFGPSEMGFLFSIVNAAPESSIKVLTSKRHLKKEIPDGAYEEIFEEAWRSICDVSPPDVELSVIGSNADGDHPIHDRWLLTECGGLRLGTSANSIGNLRISELTEIESDIAASRYEVVDGFMSRRTKMWEGGRVSLITFGLA